MEDMTSHAKKLKCDCILLILYFTNNVSIDCSYTLRLNFLSFLLKYV